MKKYILNFKSISNSLMRPVDASTVGTFRIIFGAVMAWAMCRYFYLDKIGRKYIDREFHSTYPFFDWVTPWPGNGMYYHFGILALAGLMISIGLFTRFFAVVFCLGYSYVFLLDQGEYNNHYYFMCLLGLLFCLTSTNRWMSLDALEKPDIGTGTIPWWNLFILRTQVFIVYFYGGIAKINPDWLKGDPIREFLQYRFGNDPEIGKFLTTDFSVYLFSYGGLIFDLSIGFILLYRKTRWIGIILVLLFNLTNNWMFTIGIFPVLMIGATVLFLEPDTPRKWLKKILPKIKEPNFEAAPISARFKKPAALFVSAYLAIQILVPLRHVLYPGNVSWTFEGHYFSWNMKLNSRDLCRLALIATDSETGKSWPIYPEGNLDIRQYKNICTRPHLIAQYAGYLGEKMEESGINKPVINAKVSYSLNSRPAQTLIDPEANLLEVDTNPFRHADWIVPLKE